MIPSDSLQIVRLVKQDSQGHNDLPVHSSLSSNTPIRTLRMHQERR